MGKFNGLLLVSDFDNTLVYTEEALQKCVDMPPVSDKNRAALEYFMANGGLFAVATGRAKPAFETVVDGIPMNARTVLFNAVELYHDDNTIHALNANDVTRRHMHITHAPSIEVDTMDAVPSPISKALFSTEEQHLNDLLDYLRAQPWYHDYEVVPSAVTLVELTAKGANKGGMVQRLAQLLDVKRENVLCVGDHANDISMLTWAGEGYAPANAIPLVLNTPGVHHLPDCRDDAIAALVAELDKRF